MDDTEDDARYPPNTYNSSDRQKLPARDSSYSRPIGINYSDDDDEDDADEDELDNEEDEIELGEEDKEKNDKDNGSDSVRYAKKFVNFDSDDEDDDDDDEDDVVAVGNNDTNDEVNEQKNYEDNDDADLERHPKKRKLKSLVSSYEFAPRVPPQPQPLATVPPPPPKPSFGGRNSLTDWTERETFVLLDAWGERFLQRGRKSLRSEEWHEVAEKVSEGSKIERTDTQCRNRLDTLKKKYKKEKTRIAETGDPNSKWVYFKKMDMLMSSPQQQGGGLSCGLDSGEYVFSNPKVYLNRANGIDEMRDSPVDSHSNEEDHSDGLPPKKRRNKREKSERRGGSFRLLADSIQKFSDIYEKIESSRRAQMVELEKMRMDYQRELELKKRQIMERAQEEIAKIRQGIEDENDVSGENGSE